MSSIHIEQNGVTRTLSVPADETLLSALRRAGYSIPAACGGKGLKCLRHRRGADIAEGGGFQTFSLPNAFPAQICDHLVSKEMHDIWNASR